MRRHFHLIAAVVLLAAGAHAQQAAPGGILLSISTRGELREAFHGAVARMPGVHAAAETGRRQLFMTRSLSAAGAVVDAAPEGFHYALDAMVVDAPAFARLVDGEASGLIAGLRAGEAVLGEASARLRRLGPGGQLALADGTVLTVRGIVPDEIIQKRELAVAAAGLPGAAGLRRALLVRYTGPEDTVEETLAALLPPDAPLRVRALQPSNHLRSFSPVLPQAEVKLALGEFAYRPTRGVYFERDRHWEARHLVNARVPLLGEVRCHKVLVPALRGAMQELIDRGLDFLIVPAAYRGCDNPRLIGAGRGLSRHAWGAAVDLNYSDDPGIRRNAADPRLVAVMARWGFTSGHLWGNPDPGHFEFFGASGGDT